MLNIRDYIKNNFKDSDEKEIEESIVASIKEQDEVSLPGLGVLFEALWQQSDIQSREIIIKNIKKGLI